MIIRTLKLRNLAMGAILMAGTIAAFAAQLPGTQLPQQTERSVTRPSGGTRGGRTIQFNSDNEDIYEITNQVANILGLSTIMIDPSIQGSVSILMRESLYGDDLFELFNQVLRSRNAALVFENGVYQIVPIATVMRHGLKIIDTLPEPAERGSETSPSSEIRPNVPRAPAPGNSKGIQMATYVLRVEFIPVEDLVAQGGVLTNFLTEGAPIIGIKRLNILIFTDYPENAKRVMELVRMLDKAFFDEDLIDLVKVEHAESEEIAKELSQIFGTGGAAESAAATGVSFLSLNRINSIFVMASTKYALTRAKRWIDELDTDRNKKFQSFTYVVKNSTAGDIAMMVAALLGGNDSSSGGGGSYLDGNSSGGGLIGGGRNSSQTGSNRSGSSGSSRSSFSSQNSMYGSQDGNSFNQGLSGILGGSSSLGPRLNTNARNVVSYNLPRSISLHEEARLVVDDINNFIYIQSTPTDKNTILDALKDMDVVPRQVLLEFQVWAIELTDDLGYGFTGALQAKRNGERLTTVSNDSKSSYTASVETFFNVGSAREIILGLEALKTKTNVKMLEKPTLRATDGIQTIINIGSEVPFPTGGYATTSGYSTSVDYRPVGIGLQVLPRISASGLVTLQFALDVSSFAGGTVTIGDQSAPIFSSNNISSTTPIPDGEPIAITGLFRDTNKWERGGIPVLSDIPLIGGLFGGTARSKHRSELVIIITPHVIKTEDRSQEATQGLLDSLRNISRFRNEMEDDLSKDIEDARKDRDKKDLSSIRKIKPPKKGKDSEE